MIVYGRQPVREALRGNRSVRRVWATHPLPWLRDVAVVRADDAEIEGLAGARDHQGVCAELSEFRYADGAALLDSEDALVIALDEIQDPQNLGSVCRTAECAGASGVVIGERRSAQVTPAVCKASAGAVEHLPVARARNVADYLAEAKRAGAWVYGASTAPQAIPYDRPDYRGRVVLVFGSEGRGIRPRVQASCDALIRLPMHGRIESLNIAAAAAAAMYGILHFRTLRLDRDS